MRQQIVELPAKRPQPELGVMIEYGLLDLDQIPSDFFFNSFINQPLVWFQTKIIPRKQKRDEQAPGAQRATAYVQQCVVLAQSQGRQQIELSRCDDIIFFRRSDKAR